MAQVFATWNPSDKGAHITLSNGNLTAIADSGQTNTWDGVRSTVSVSSGKWYWEITYNNFQNGSSGPGICDSTASLSTNNSAGYANGFSGLEYYAAIVQSTYIINNVNTNIDGGTANGDVFGFALDMNSDTISFYKNGVLVSPSSISIGSTMSATNVFAVFQSNYFVANNAQITANFGATPFAFTVPSGYNAGLYTGVADSNSHFLNLLGVGT